MEELLKNSAYKIKGKNCSGLKLMREWKGEFCKLRLINTTSEEATVQEVVVFDMPMPFPADTPIYGEGYTMLSQYDGTVSNVQNIGCFSDKDHYRFPQTAGMNTVYNLILFFTEEVYMLAFSSCFRYQSEIRFNENTLQIVLDFENTPIKAHESRDLEEFMFAHGKNKDELLERLGDRLFINHKVPIKQETPTGWCSWHSYGPDVTKEIIFRNMAAIQEKGLPLKNIQIDDGFQTYMGDWFDSSSKFGVGIEKIIEDIKSEGFVPAIWLAPFIAEKNSVLFQEHPDYFVKDEKGEPLSSDRDSFGGWRNPPWYCLDGTNPNALKFLYEVFKKYTDWGVKYFKLDANVWGAFPFGRRCDPTKTRVEAYRMAMEVILSAVGDGFVLGCNAPMWPSIGVIHGNRVSCDVIRNWHEVSHVARETLVRNWQNNKLWINDPDCLLLQNCNLNVIGNDGHFMESERCSEEEYSFHRSFIFASGGLILSADKLNELSDENLKHLKKLFPPIRVSAKFTDSSLEVGFTKINKNSFYVTLLNWQNNEKTMRVKLPYRCKIQDFFADTFIGSDNVLKVKLSAHDGKVLYCVAEGDKDATEV